MGDLSRILPSWVNLLVVPGLIAGFTIHELAHAIVAYVLGDESQVARGRISLNPLRHIFWLGMLTFVLFGFGWARPVRMDMRSFKNRYLGLFLVSASGAVANLVLAGLCLVLTVLMAMVVAAFSSRGAFEILRSFTVEAAAQPDIVAWTAAFTTHTIYVNLALAFFNLLPLPGLDGFSILVSFFGLVKGVPDKFAPLALENEKQSAVWGAPAAQRGRQPADIHFERGAEYHAGGNYVDAIARYRQAISSDSHYGPAYVNLGLSYLAAGQRERAIQAFRGATQYATDEQSRQAAWAQLHKLSQFNPAAQPSAPVPAAESPAPWTGTKPSLNWSAFWLNSMILLVVSMGIYTCLTIALIRHFS
jgi:Zn-dependent protease